ncbi:TPA: hypothetical protein SCR93_004632 [Escherichia coli]|nr:hypothetical protein [Escherichia coli]
MDRSSMILCPEKPFSWRKTFFLSGDTDLRCVLRSGSWQIASSKGSPLLEA